MHRAVGSYANLFPLYLPFDMSKTSEPCGAIDKIDTLTLPTNRHILIMRARDSCHVSYIYSLLRARDMWWDVCVCAPSIFINFIKLGDDLKLDNPHSINATPRLKLILFIMGSQTVLRLLSRVDRILRHCLLTQERSNADASESLHVQFKSPFI